MSEHEDLELLARQRTAYVAIRLAPLLAAFDAARPVGWRSSLPHPPHWARPWSEEESPTLLRLLGAR